MFTESNQEYQRAGFMRKLEYLTVEPTTYEMAQKAELDPLSPEIHDFIDSLNEFTMVTWQGQQITTLCQLHHGTVTTIWIVLMVNGMLSRTELRNGMELRFPTPAALRNSLTIHSRRTVANANGSNKGQIVII